MHMTSSVDENLMADNHTRAGHVSSSHSHVVTSSKQRSSGKSGSRHKQHSQSYHNSISSARPADGMSHSYYAGQPSGVLHGYAYATDSPLRMSENVHDFTQILNGHDPHVASTHAHLLTQQQAPAQQRSTQPLHGLNIEDYTLKPVNGSNSKESGYSSNRPSYHESQLHALAHAPTASREYQSHHVSSAYHTDGHLLQQPAHPGELSAIRRSLLSVSCESTLVNELLPPGND